MKVKDKINESIRSVKKTLGPLRNAIFSKNDLQEIALRHLPDVGSTQKALIKGQLLRYLWETEMLKEVKFAFPSRSETRFVYGDITPYELAQSLKPNAYLVHRVAMFMNGLCDDHDTIHINVEQSKDHHRNSASLTQEGIDRAFRNKVRTSNEIAQAEGITVCITHGQKTNLLGVDTRTVKFGKDLRVTNLERTLIDITVRPVYAGGATEVLAAYRRASATVSIERLEETLRKMNFVYPYHQAIGFYMERSESYSERQLEIFRKYPRLFDFNLDYRLQSPSYDEEWRLFYPHDLV